MFKTLVKSFFNPSGNSYKLLSYYFNYSNKKYLPKKIDAINKILDNLSTAIEKNMPGKSIDLLHIDAEGYNLEILKTLDFTETLPKVILTEFKNLDVANWKLMISLLHANQYKVYRHNQDYISLHNTIHDLYIQGTNVFPFWE